MDATKNIAPNDRMVAVTMKAGEWDLVWELVKDLSDRKCGECGAALNVGPESERTRLALLSFEQRLSSGGVL